MGWGVVVEANIFAAASILVEQAPSERKGVVRIHAARDSGFDECGQRMIGEALALGGIPATRIPLPREPRLPRHPR